MSLTIAYTTFRFNPRINWFFSSLKRELIRCDFNEHCKIMIVDYHSQFHSSERYEYYNNEFQKYFSDTIHTMCVIPPKPSAWQGPWRCTQKDYFAPSDTRNTVFINCQTPYIVFVDDLSALSVGWLDVVMWGLLNNKVIIGSYKKVKNLKCNNEGEIIFDEIVNVDNRYTLPNIKNDFVQKVPGEYFYGCVFGLPLELALKVDGFDESFDGQGGEDMDFGLRLGKQSDVYYSKQMLVYEDEFLHFESGNFKPDSVPKYCCQSDDMDMYLIRLSQQSDRCLPFKINNFVQEREHFLKHKCYSKYNFEDQINWRTNHKICEDF